MGAIRCGRLRTADGIFLVGVRGDLGWEVADSYLTEDGTCAAVAIVASNGLSADIILASTNHYSISEVYQVDPDQGGFIAGEVGGRAWIPTPDSGIGSFGPDHTADAYRDGRLTFGDRCELLIRDH